MAVIVVIGLVIVLFWFVLAYTVTKEKLSDEKKYESKRLFEANELYRAKEQLWQQEKDYFLDEIARLRTEVEDWKDRTLQRSGHTPIQQRNQKTTPNNQAQVYIPSKAAQVSAAKRFKDWNPTEEDSDFS